MDGSNPTSAERRGLEASALVEAAKGGDVQAFEELYNRYRQRIYALALHLTGRPSDADDITQDAFLKAYKKIDSFEGRSEFFTWLYRIALHRALNVKRNRKKRPTVGMDDPRVSAAIAVDAYGDPQRALELQERYAKLLASFDNLSPSLRTTVVLTTLQGLSYKEAAIVLNTTEGTVAWRVHEARRKLKDAIRRLEKEPTPQRFVLRARRITASSDVAGRLEHALSNWSSIPAPG